jgi:predicted RNA-binding Zn ribbon-like protein
MNGSQSALLLRDFVNTHDLDADVDEFGAPADLGAWLAEHGLVPIGAHPEESDLVMAVSLREGLRDALRDRALTTPAVLAELPLRVELVSTEPVGPDAAVGSGSTGSGSAVGSGAVGSGTAGGSGAAVGSGGVVEPRLVPVGDGVRAGLARIAAAIVVSRSDGSWARLKVCQEGSCQWAFLDTSKNRSRSWCSMRLCGNRTKTRAYRARRRDAAG